MAILCFLKLGATVVSYASGNAGGIFAPTLYIGAMAGGAVGMVVHRVAPFPTADPGAYALVGMGTLFAGIVRAPMTSVFMIFEITQDYQILVPLMVANLLSFAISKRYQPMPIYHSLRHQDGIHLPSPGSQGPLSTRTAGQVMRTDVSFIGADMPAQDAWRGIAPGAQPGYLVGTPDGLVGVITREQLERWNASEQRASPVGSLLEGDFVHVHPDQPLDVVLDRLSESNGLLPVVSRTDVRRVEGVVTPDSVVAGRNRRGRGTAEPGVQRGWG